MTERTESERGRAPGGRRWAAGLLLVAALAPLPAIPARAADPVNEDGEEMRLPLTLERIWYRTGKQRGVLGPKYSGDLTVTAEALEFSSNKHDLSIPWTTTRLVSYGKMRGDVDTDWVVLSVAADGESELVGLRDGRKLGYGQRTRELFETLLATAEQLGAAQYAVPDGFAPYTELDHQFVLAVPQGWSSHHQSLAGIGGLVLWGTVVFSPEPLIDAARAPGSSGRGERERARRRIERGEVTAWIVDRREAQRGMTCAELTDKAVETLRGWIAETTLLSAGIAGIDAVPIERTSIDRCAGVRLVARGGSAGETKLLEVRAASDDRTVFLIGLRTVGAREEADRERFDRGVASLQFSVAR